jgi:hypothetical protein
MPPKQKEVKKGPAYKTAIPLKDIVPADIKEPPREPKPLKTPESFSEPPKNVTLCSFRAKPCLQSLKSGRQSK